MDKKEENKWIWYKNDICFTCPKCGYKTTVTSKICPKCDNKFDDKPPVFVEKEN